jgi:hypothetical protein
VLAILAKLGDSGRDKLTFCLFAFTGHRALKNMASTPPPATSPPRPGRISPLSPTILARKTTCISAEDKGADRLAIRRLSGEQSLRRFGVRAKIVTDKIYFGSKDDLYLACGQWIADFIGDNFRPHAEAAEAIAAIFCPAWAAMSRVVACWPYSPNWAIAAAIS